MLETALPDDGVPCPRCTELAKLGGIRFETVMPLYNESVLNPLSKDGKGKCCCDCASADLLLSMGLLGDFLSARVAVGNDRQSQFRLPGVPMGLCQNRFVKYSARGDLERHLEWLNHWFPGWQETSV